jgi:Domain of Unknown Function with PDB structure (DUF3857)/Transglutaminase-like superfamily
MTSHCMRLAVLVVFALALGTAPMAQPLPSAPADAEHHVPAPSTSYSLSYQSHLTVRADLTATNLATKRLKILAPAAIQPLSQQQLLFVEGMQTVDILEAFTEKADGTRIAVEAANIVTRDGASGLAATYARDLKQRTIIFPDVGVGDTLVTTYKWEIGHGPFPGQFFHSEVFARSQPITSAEVIVEAPRALDLQVSTTGTGLTDRSDDIGDIRRHTVTLAPGPYVPEEPRAVASIDRDPALLVSTFKSYEELGLAYRALALPKSAVTPEISLLADEITRGIVDKKAQAIAIDAWMKKHIRYVAVYLAVGRVVPNEAAAVLHNKYGDCKDKVTLMSALLAAKGIASEAALINLGNAYTLPDPPTLTVLNHVIVYLPDFDVYDDPTAGGAAFGVLAPEAYDKPVVRVSASAATLARTPAMRPQDHTSHSRTVLHVAADGSVTGETQESATGALAIALRGAAAAVQNLGSEAAARRVLQGFGTPGTGSFDLSHVAEPIDPANVQGSFVLDTKFRPPRLPGRAAVPFGMPLLTRPGNFLLPPRLSGRASAFVCYAGEQTEDIEATFADGFPMPVAPPALRIDKPLLAYRSSFQVEGRALKIHREFASRVTGQSCAPQVEAQIAGDLNLVWVHTHGGFAFVSPGQSPAASAPKPAQPVELARVVAADQKLRLDFLYSINPDCSSIGFSTVRIIEPPKNGRLTVENGAGFTNFPQGNPRFDCNKRRSDGVVLQYEPNPGFSGTDSLTVDVVFPSGSSSQRHYAIAVK